MDLAIWVQILNETICISHSADEKNESNYYPSSYELMVGQTDNLTLD